MKLRKVIGAVKIYFNADWDEFVVKPSLREEEWYFTSDYEDAIDTAKAMAKQSQKGE